MNDNLNKEVITLPPFKRLCMTIGELPSSYVETMTYYESLLWFCNYLGKTVIPTINNNAEAVEELQTKYIELKDYVDNYFENLDVQEEINNKLDEMAESGELADIIAQYLQVASILAFDTKAALKAAENLVDGSITKTIGNITYNDGKGNFYKIRTLTSGDVIDDDLIVALTNYPTLIAEKLPDYEINQLNNKVDTLEEKTEEIENIITNCPDLLFGVSFKAPGMGVPTEMDYVISLDGINFSNIKIDDFALRDPSIVYDSTRKKFYLTGTPATQTDYTFVLYESEDLQTWTSHYVAIPNYLTNLKWAPDLYYDETADKLIVTFSYEYGTETDSDGQTIPAFDIIICDTTDFTNFEMSNVRVATLTNSFHRSHIDSNIIKYNNLWYMVVNEQYSKTLEIYTSSDLTNFTLKCQNILNNNDKSDNTIYLEGACQYLFNNEYHVVADSYAHMHTLINGKSNNQEDFELSATNLNYFRHGSIISITNNEAKQLISKLPNFNLNTADKLTPTPEDHPAVYIKANQNREMTAIPNSIFFIEGNATITNLRNSFNCDEQKFCFITNTNVTVNINKFDEITKTVPLINTSYNNEKTISVSLNKNSYIFGKNSFEELTVYRKQDVIDRIINLNENMIIYDAVAYRAGNVLQIFIDIQLTSSINAYIGLFKFNNVDFQPRAKLQLNSDTIANIAMFNDGQVSGGINGAANSHITITGTYITK